MQCVDHIIEVLDLVACQDTSKTYLVHTNIVHTNNRECVTNMYEFYTYCIHACTYNIPAFFFSNVLLILFHSLNSHWRLFQAWPLWWRKEENKHSLRATYESIFNVA